VTALRFAISIPQLVTDEFDAGEFRAYLARAEELGFESGWTLEQVLGTAPMLNPTETLTYAAACTERLRLGCVVYVSTLHSPVHLAKSLSTLDQLSRGRLEVGVGTGGQGRMFSAFAVDPATLVSRFTESLQLIKALWTEPRVTFHGGFWQLDDAAMEPKPVQQPHPPIWFGANHPAALRRAVRLGDGFFGAGSSTTARFVEQVQVVRAALAETGRDPASFRIAKRVYIGVDDDPDRARRQVVEQLQRVYPFLPPDGLEAMAVHGGPDECVAGLREVADAGAELILVNPVFDEHAQMERLAAEVLPKLA
jgi:probable F420-dependent oxidoreductase